MESGRGIQRIKVVIGSVGLKSISRNCVIRPSTVVIGSVGLKFEITGVRCERVQSCNWICGIEMKWVRLVPDGGYGVVIGF